LFGGEFDPMPADRYAVIAITLAILQDVDAGAFRGYLAAKSRNFRIPEDRVAQRRFNRFDDPFGDFIAHGHLHLGCSGGTRWRKASFGASF
jgi:hypothetical protein